MTEGFKRLNLKNEQLKVEKKRLLEQNQILQDRIQVIYFEINQMQNPILPPKESHPVQTQVPFPQTP